MSLKGQYKPEDINYLRKMSTFALVEECEEAEIFDGIWFEQIRGRPRSFITISRGEYIIMIARENLLHGKDQGFRATEDKPTLITYLGVGVSDKQLQKIKGLGTWDALPLFPKHRDTFKEPEKKDPVFRGFLHDVLQIFG